MSAKGRPTTNPATLARKELIGAIQIMAATESDALRRVSKTVTAMTKNPEGFASATGTNMLGNGLRATVRDAMVAAQDGQCFTCGVALDKPGHPYTDATLFRLVPSIVGADETVSGVDAMSAGTLPGNVVAVCAHCNKRRNQASAVTGSPVAVTHDVMHKATDGPVMLNATRILYTWPASPKAKADTREDHVMANRDAARIALLGW